MQARGRRQVQWQWLRMLLVALMLTIASPSLEIIGPLGHAVGLSSVALADDKDDKKTRKNKD